MRSRTEMVTTQLEGSDFDEETDLEDSEDDWKPEKKTRPRSIKTTITTSKRTNNKRKVIQKNIPKRGRRPTKKYKAEETSSESESDSSSDNEPIFNLMKNKTKFKQQQKPAVVVIKKCSPKSNSSQSPPLSPKELSEVCLLTTHTRSFLFSSSNANFSFQNLAIQRPLQRKTTSLSKTFPDRNGIFELLVCKSELKDGIKENYDLCLWRRDGCSLLQKYIRDRESRLIDHIFISSSVV